MSEPGQEDAANRKDVLDALDDFLEELRREFKENPEFAYRAVRALGANVEITGPKAVDLVNPIWLVSQHGVHDTARRLSTFTPAQLKKIAKNSSLATPTDMAGKSSEDLITLIVKRAQIKIEERTS
ncbi:MAG: hypothetical protein QNI84_00960 [Henriciella sp.]|nr:hypothetical protein [Henriciella sp.]